MPATHRLDWAGAILVTLGLGGIVNGFIESTSLGWRNPVVFGSTIAGFGCVVAFVLMEMYELRRWCRWHCSRTRALLGQIC